jgi:hypothetical protein
MGNSPRVLPSGKAGAVQDRLDAACRRALEINACSYSSVQSILKNGLDSRPRTRATDEPAITHTNIRGADYFH